MGRNLKRAAVVAAATVLMVVPSATANAAGDAVNCAVNGGHCESGFIAANTQYHCLKYSVHRSWWGSTSWAVRDWDTLVNVAQGTIG